MCGGFALVCAGSGGARGTIAYHLGRLLGYVALGGAAGFLGAAANVATQAALGWAGAAATAMGLLLLLQGARLMLRPRAALPLVTLGRHRPGLLRALRLAGARFLQRRDPLAAFGVGALVAVLPCGWLWAFVASAAGTGSALAGGCVMLAFFVGTVPALVGAALLGAKVWACLPRVGPRLGGALLVVMGLATLAGKLAPLVPGAAAAGTDGAPPPCHGTAS
jgi:hypothetical protein